MKNKFKLIIRLFQFGKYLAKYYVLAVGFAVLGFVVTVVIPVYLLNLFFTIEPSWIHLIGLCLLAILRGLMRYGEHYYGHYVAFRVLAKFRMLVFSKLRKLAPGKLDTQNKGQLLKVIGEDIEALEVFFAHTLPPISTAIIVSVILMVYFASIHIYLALIALVTYIILAIIIPNVFAVKLHPLLQKQNTLKKAYTAQFLEILNGIFDLVQNHKTKSFLSDLNGKSKAVNLQEKQIAGVGIIQSASSFFVIGLMILLFSIIAFQLDNKLAALSGVVVFAGSFAPYLELARLPLGLKKALNAASDIFELFDEKEIDKSGDKNIFVLEEVNVKEVLFSYDNRDQLILNQVNLQVSNNQIIGIIGKSGSGKSTLMKLIMKWYLPTTGTIYLNQENLFELDGNQLQNEICYVGQFPKIFNQTIRENLTLGKEISEEEIVEVCKRCNIWDVIERLDKKLDTPLRFDSKIFSAGELQRLELARAFLKKANCYIFDEPTSNLDSLNEAIFLNLIKEYCEGIVFLISHRKSTTSIADVVYSVENGNLERRV